MKAGIPLEKMYVSSEGIPFLRNFLNCCGFSKTEIQRLTNELLDTDHASDRKINIITLFSKLSDLRTAVQRKKIGPVLDASAVPHLAVILHRLGINARHIKEVLSEGRSVDGDLNMETLLQGLRRILDNAEHVYRGKPFDELPEAFKQIFSPLGMNEEIEKARGEISLDRFVQLLEEGISKTKNSHASNQNVEEAMMHLVGEVVVDSDESDARLQLRSRTAQRLIDDLLGTKNKNKESDVSKTRVFSHKGGDQHAIHETNFDAIPMDTEKISRMLEYASNEETHRAMWRDTQKMSIFETVADNHPFTGSVTAEQPSAIPSPRSLPLYVMDQVSYQISRSITEGKNNIKLRLKPPHLGTVKLEMEMKGNVLKLDVTTESQVTKELLLSHIQELQKGLHEQGIRLERMDVHANYQFGESMKNTQQEHNRESDWARGRSSTCSAVLGIESGDKEEEITMLRTRMDSLLDLIA
jgi:hypothetical protein